jgi:hypothetical protein
MNVMFSADDFKGDITAVVFQPNQKIYRWDDETKTSYYVFMSRDTIRKMLMKLSRLKPKDLINYEHSGMVFSGDDVYTYENWLVGDNPKMDKSYEMFGREFEPGTWLTTIHFRDRRIFDEFVLSQKTSSISLEGMFEEVPFNFFDVKEEMTNEDFITEYIPYEDIAEQYCNCDYGYTAIGFKIGDKSEYKCVEENSEEAMEYNAAQLVMRLEALLKEMDKSIS